MQPGKIDQARQWGWSTRCKPPTLRRHARSRSGRSPAVPGDRPTNRPGYFRGSFCSPGSATQKGHCDERSGVTRKRRPHWLVRLLNHPEKRNALSLELMNALLAKLDRVAEDEEVRVVVIRGSGTMFSAGHDIREMAGKEKGLHHFRTIFATCNRMMQRLHQLPQPVIAQVHGIATAAGCQLVAACDLAIAAEGTRFATPGVKIGLFLHHPDGTAGAPHWPAPRHGHAAFRPLYLQRGSRNASAWSIEWSRPIN